MNVLRHSARMASNYKPPLRQSVWTSKPATPGHCTLHRTVCFEVVWKIFKESKVLWMYWDLVARMASNYKPAMRQVCLDIEASRPRPLHIASKSLFWSSLKNIWRIQSSMNVLRLLYFADNVYRPQLHITLFVSNKTPKYSNSSKQPGVGGPMSVNFKMCFWCLHFSQKTNLKTQIFALAYWGSNFCSFFGRIEKTKTSFQN